jgi:hypothetical protein
LHASLAAACLNDIRLAQAARKLDHNDGSKIVLTAVAACGAAEKTIANRAMDAADRSTGYRKTRCPIRCRLRPASPVAIAADDPYR